MKKLLPLLLLTVSGLLALPTSLHAEDAKPGGKKGGPGGAGRGNPEERLKMMTEKLGLSEEQQGKIKAIQEKDGAMMKEMMAKGRENLTEEDKTKMKTHMEEIGAVLTPEQKEKMKEMRGAGGPGGKRGEGKPGAGKPGEKK